MQNSEEPPESGIESLRPQHARLHGVMMDRAGAELGRPDVHNVRSQYSATTSSPQLCFFSLLVSVKPAFS